MYLEEFEDIDWVKNSQLLNLMECIARGDPTQVITAPQYLLDSVSHVGAHSDHHPEVVLAHQAHREVLVHDSLQGRSRAGLQGRQHLGGTDPTNGQGFQRNTPIPISQYYAHQISFLPLILYSQSQNLLHLNRVAECWELVLAK